MQLKTICSHKLVKTYFLTYNKSFGFICSGFFFVLFWYLSWCSQYQQHLFTLTVHLHYTIHTTDEQFSLGTNFSWRNNPHLYFVHTYCPCMKTVPSSVYGLSRIKWTFCFWFKKKKVYQWCKNHTYISISYCYIWPLNCSSHIPIFSVTQMIKWKQNSSHETCGGITTHI